MDQGQALDDFVNLDLPQCILDPRDVAARLQEYRAVLLNLLTYKGPNADSKKQVESLVVVSDKYGEMRLDQEPDVRMALQLSTDLKLDEVQCVELLSAAQEHNVLTHEAAAGVYFKDRLLLAKGTADLLAMVALHDIDQHLYGGAVTSFVQSLLAERSGGRAVLVSRLLACIRESGLESPAPGCSADVVDDLGQRVSRRSYLASERHHLSRALLYAVAVSPLLPAADMAEMVEVAGTLADKVAAAAGAEGRGVEHALLQQAANVLLACVNAMLPHDTYGSQQETDLAALAANAEVKAKAAPAGDIKDGYRAVLCLAHAMMQAPRSPSTPTGSGAAAAAAATHREQMERAFGAGALGFLRDMLGRVHFTKELRPHSQLATGIVYDLLTQLLHADSGDASRSVEALLQAASLARQARQEREDAAQSQALMVVDALAGASDMESDKATGQAEQDDLATLLHCLAACFSVHPHLWLGSAQSQSYSAVAELLGRVMMSRTVQAVPEVGTAVLDVMASLVSGKYGASFIIHQMNQNAASGQMEMLTWRKVFSVIALYCNRFMAALQGGASGQQAAEMCMNRRDAHGLIAYLRLFTKILSQGERHEVQAWLHGIQAEVADHLQGAPLHELLFQLMCHPVYNRVKAALDDALAAYSRFPELAPRFLERLMQGMLVGAGTPQDGFTVPRHDIARQLGEVEALEALYPETLAFVRLLNAHLAQVVSSTPLGAAFLPYTRFVVDAVLGRLHQRAHKDERQKWQLAAAAFQHMELMLQSLDLLGPLLPEHLLSMHPGLYVLEQMLTCGPAYQAMQAMLQGGYLELEQADAAGEAGPARRGAVLAALRLLNAVLLRDTDFVEQTARLQTRIRYQALDMALRRPDHLPQLLEFVNISFSSAIQAQALLLVRHMCYRVPDLVLLLLQMPNGMGTCLTLRSGFATALRQGLMGGPDVEEEEQEEEEEQQQDGAAEQPGAQQQEEQAALILDLMVELVEAELVPSLTHLLMGYEVGPDPTLTERAVLLPRQEYSCLTVVLDALQAGEHQLSVARPALYAKCLRLLHELARRPVSGPPMLDLLAPPAGGDLLAQLCAVLVSELPPPAPEHALAAAQRLEQRAELLQLQALQLLRAERPEAVRSLVEALLQPAAGQAALPAFGAGGAPGAGASVLMRVLDEAACMEVPEPSSSQVSGEQHRLLQEVADGEEMSLDALVTNVQALQQLGLMCPHKHDGPLIYDVPRLMEAMDSRITAHEQATGVERSAARLAAAAVAEYASRYNAFVLLASGQQALVRAWQQVMLVLFTRQYDAVGACFGGRQAELLHDSLLATLAELRQLLGRQEAAVSAELGGTIRVLLSKLQEQAALSPGAGLPQDPLASVRLPAQCHQLLAALLDCVRLGRRTPLLRMQLYSALLQFLNFARGGRLGDASPLVLQSLLAGLGEGAASAAQLDSAQTELDRGMAALVQQQREELVGLLAQDAQASGGQRGVSQAVALHLLAALASADASGLVSEQAFASGLPRALLQGLPDATTQLMAVPLAKLHPVAHVVDAQLALLLRLAEAGAPRSALQRSAAKALHDLQALQHLASCRALDYDVEEPGELLRQQPGSTRERMHHLVAPVLRLVLALVSAFPESAAVRADACRFIDSHQRMVVRILREVTSPVSSSWQPGDQELQEALLLVQLLARLVPTAGELGPATYGNLRADMFRLWLHFGGLDSRSMNHIVQSMQQQQHQALADGAADGAAASARAREKQAAQVAALRGALAGYLRLLVSSPSGGELLPAVGSDTHMVSSTDDSGTRRPTLMLLRNTTEQACTDVERVVGQLERGLAFLGSGGGAAAGSDTRVIDQQLQLYGPASQLIGSLTMAAKGRVALQSTVKAAGAQLLQLQRLLYLLENSLAIVLEHFIACLPRPAGSAMAADDEAAANGQQQPAPEDARRLGHPGDLSLFATRMRESCSRVETVVELVQDVAKLRVEELDLLNRQLRAYLSSL